MRIRPYPRRLLAACLLPISLAHADYRETIGHTALVDELQLRGLNVPTGLGIPVTQVEAREDTDRNGTLDPNEGYMPDAADSQFGSVTINDISNLGQDPSGHARTVGRNLYGSTFSMATGITEVDVYEGSDWLSSGWQTGPSTPPTETNPLQNHSWVNFTNSSTPTRRMDFAVNRDGFLPVFGLFNADFGGTPPTDIPAIYGSAYNGIAVGRSDGLHVTGVTSSDGSGRVKPEIVAPRLSTSGTRFTSFVTPFVTATAALLLEEAPGYGADADEPETLKAILLAAASKEPFAPDWDQTTTRPIDEVFGAGELDVYEAYWIQRAGEQPQGSTLDRRGWNFTSIGNNGTHVYNLTVPAGFELCNLSVLLTWNREVSFRSGLFGGYTPSLADLELRLKSGSSTLQTSDSSVDNLEHIWRDDSAALAAGSYTLEVRTDDAVDYALAWRSELYQDYALWSTTAFTAATPASERDPEDDPEADGIPNRLEQAFGGDPEVYDRFILPEATIVEDGGSRYLEIAVRIPTFKNELSYTVESSTALDGPWASPAGDFERVSIGPSADPNFDLHTYRRTTPVEAGGEAFVRVSVSP